MARPVHANAQLLEAFYRALGARDADGMAACYHPEAHFTDPVFDLRGAEVGAMWRMLCERGEDLVIDFGGIEADEGSGRARWEARYTFLATKRRVHNSIDASFGFEEGRIVRHVDTFDFWRWSRQALGLPGLVMGWSGLMRRKVARMAAENLQRFIAAG